MANKPKGFASFIAWASMAVGLFYVYATASSLLYLAQRGMAEKGIAYAVPTCIAMTIFIAGFTLLKGYSWSRYLYLLLSALAALSLYKFIPTILILLHGVSDPAANASLLFIAALALSNAKLAIFSAAITFFVFRHFRKQKAKSGPTLQELTGSGS